MGGIPETVFGLRHNGGNMTHSYTHTRDAYYWQWMEEIERNTARLYPATRAANAPATRQLALFIPPDPELAACFYHDEKSRDIAY